MTLSPIAAARERHRLADVAARTGIHLQQSTGSITVRCPFPAHGHPDRAPSLRLYLDDDRYYCFGCESRGDVVQWARDTDQLTVADALRLLDSGQPIRNAWAAHPEAARPRHPTRLTDGPDPSRTPAHRILRTLDAAWACYSDRDQHRAGAAYLARRGLDVGVVENQTGRAEVGHTLDGRLSLVAVLRAEGFTADELIDAGVARRSLVATRLVDAYRRRVLVPIRTPEGSVCALIGRNVGDQHAPKYLNPPRTAVYDKSVDLYHPLPAPPDRRCRAVVVEGTLDALAVAAAVIRAGATGQLWPVTQSGRELSGFQIERILSVCCRPPLLALDADHAGAEAAERIRAALAARDVAATRAFLPEDHDPASWLATITGRSPVAAKAALQVLTGLRGTGGRATSPVAVVSPGAGVDL